MTLTIDDEPLTLDKSSHNIKQDWCASLSPALCFSCTLSYCSHCQNVFAMHTFVSDFEWLLSANGSLSSTLCCSCGGILITSEDGKIVCNQTLNSRLQVAYDTALPCIKPTLFNQLGSKHTC